MTRFQNAFENRSIPTALEAGTLILFIANSNSSGKLYMIPSTDNLQSRENLKVGTTVVLLKLRSFSVFLISPRVEEVPYDLLYEVTLILPYSKYE